jgi:hypothetical protein
MESRVCRASGRSAQEERLPAAHDKQQTGERLSVQALRRRPRVLCWADSCGRVLGPSRGAAAAAAMMRERRMPGVWWRYAIRRRAPPGCRSQVAGRSRFDARTQQQWWQARADAGKQVTQVQVWVWCARGRGMRVLVLVLACGSQGRRELANW